MTEAIASAPPRLERATRLIDGDPALFRERFNRADFGLAHNLSSNPLFSLPALLDLAKSMPPAFLTIHTGDIRIDQRFDEIPPNQMSTEELIDRIENAGAWIVIQKARLNPDYAKIIDQGLDEINELSGGSFPKKMSRRNIEFFITSPNRVTPYHIDQGCSFLLQIHGSKLFHVFDKYDRDVLPERELERYWTVDRNAAKYRPELQKRAHTYDLKPGTGVHVPVNAPHWVQNSNNVSVSMSIYFFYESSAIGNIYRTNFLLRKLGLNPIPPGRSPIRDTFKGAVVGRAFDVAKKLGLKRNWKKSGS
jgi:hypothetical protein